MVYPVVPTSGDNAGCQLCHAASTQNLNPYGKAICDQSGSTAARILAVETADSDADLTGSSNITEINASAQPGWTTTAVPTYARGNCQPTGFTELTHSYIPGLWDPEPTNLPPVAANDSYTTAEDTPLTVAAPGVLDNDTDMDGDTLNAFLSTNVTNGTLALNPDGSFNYMQNVNFSGSDTFTYIANDGLADSIIATVTITVNPVNDKPMGLQ